MSNPQNRYTLVGMATETSPEALSQIPGVRIVTQAKEGQQTVWRDGIATTTPDVALDWDPAHRWRQMEKPVRGTQKRPIRELRRMAREEGYVLVLDRSRPATEEQVRQEEFLFGGPIFYSNDLPNFPPTVPLRGVAIHYNPMHRSLAVRGELNPTIGYGTTHGTFDKVEEMRVFRQYAPEDIAASSDFSDVFAKRPELEAARADLAKRVREYLVSEPASSRTKELKKKLSDFLNSVHEAARTEHPDGYFLKSSEDWATTESDQLITSDTFSPGDYADTFLYFLSGLRGKPNPHRNLRGHVLESENSFIYMVHDLVSGGQTALLQGKLPVKESTQGNNIEFRVDVFQGEVVNSTFRMGYEAYPKEQREAADFVRKFLAKFPDRIRYMSAGFDVVQLKDGSYKIIESNAGTASSMALPDTYPITANIALSNFLGRRTPLMVELDKAYAGGVDARAKYLGQLKSRQKNWPSDVSLPADEVLVYFRDKAIADFEKLSPRDRANPKNDPYLVLAELLKHPDSPSGKNLWDLAYTAHEYWLRENRR